MRAGRAWVGRAWVGRAWAGLEWAGRAWAGQEWAGPAWAGRAWMRGRFGGGVFVAVSAGGVVSAGCVAPPDPPAYEDTGHPDDCTPGEGPATGIVAAVTAIETVVRVTWETPEGVEGRVVFETALGEQVTPDSHGPTHEALLLGNRVHSDVRWRVESTDGAETSCGAWHTTTTGALPTGLPDVTLADVSLPAGAPAGGPGWIVTPIFGADDAWVAILDAEGAYVWAWRPDGDKSTAFYSAELAHDGSALLLNVNAQSATTPGPIYRLGLDGVLGDPVLVNGAHTDFVQLPDGGFGVLSWEVRAFDDRNLLGDTLVEVDAAGATRTVWNVFDDFAPDLSRSYEPGWYPGDPAVEDWSHVNGIAYDAATDAFLVTLTFNEAVASIDRTTGALNWLLADDTGDFTATESVVRYPHSVQPVDGGVLVFNRGDIHDPSACSEATELHLEDGAATVAWEWDSGRCLLVPFLGNATRLVDGTTVVDWTTAGQVDQVSADGTLLWRLNLDLGAAFGFLEVVGDLYGRE